jgi:hypothetical protein
MTPHLCHSSCGRFRTEELGQATLTLLHKTIHISAATVDSVWYFNATRFFNLWISFCTLCANCPWEFCRNSIGKAVAALTAECGSSPEGFLPASIPSSFCL